MSPKIFITGGTGFIGGSVLNAIVTAHPEYEVSALLRNPPANFATLYPNVKVIKGDYDSFDILADAAAGSDVVVHNGSSDHEPSLNALIAGLIRRPTPGYLIHLSGTGIVSDWHSEQHLGKLNPKVWSDLNDLAEINSLPDAALHRNTEKLLSAAIAEHGNKINIAIMCPPDIYGQGRGPGKTSSAFVPMFIKEIKNLDGKVFYCGEGTNTRSWVHIDDLMQVYLKVVEAAVSGGGDATWGTEGYYFAGSQEVSHIDVARAMGQILQKHGVVENGELVQLPLEELDSMISWYPKLARYLFASNSRTRAERAKKLLGYAPKAPTLFEALEEDIVTEIKKA